MTRYLMEMNNYLAEIEKKYSSVRGMPSMLSPIDWHLAATWEEQGIPLRIVLRAMDDVAKRFNGNRRPDRINSLRYFTQAVEKAHLEWARSQVGRPEGDGDSQAKVKREPERLYEELQTVRTLLNSYGNAAENAALGEPMNSAVEKVVLKLSGLAAEMSKKRLDLDEIENRLLKLRAMIEISMVASVSSERLDDIQRSVDQDFDGVVMTQRARNRICNKRLHKNFSLPELTLYEI
ncbi:MAG TPA: hypothetical protein VMM38_01520 [Aridibacter sp.]|nr:hypothetical protein [Aridibacter sp.]